MDSTNAVTKKRVIIVVVSLIVFAFVSGIFVTKDFLGSIESDIDDTEEEISFAGCNITAFSLYGYLETYTSVQPYGEEANAVSSDDLVYNIELAEKESGVKAVMLVVDSGGGDGVAGEEVANALKRLSKPTVAVIRGIGASAAYWAATGADKIYASKMSDVGGIGVTMSYLDPTSKNEKEGLKYVELSSAKYKDLFDIDKPITFEEKNIILSDLKKAHVVFVDAVATNRNLKPADVNKLANGLTFVGADALVHGLIDEIGDTSAATAYLAEKIGARPQVCWY